MATTWKKQDSTPIKAVETVKPVVLDEVAVKIALKIIKMPGIEGCSLFAYPDPASDLYKELSKRNLLGKFMKGEFEIPDDMLDRYSGAPWTCGWGETNGVKQGDVWTQGEADSKLEARVRRVMSDVLKVCPQLALEPPSRTAACTSLAYNIGADAFAKSTVCRETQEKDYEAAALAFLLWNKAGGKVMDGLVKRRKIESDLYRSV